MDEFVDQLLDILPYWITVILSLGAGMIGAYGRERHEGRAPTKAWWTNRALIMPFLLITAVWVTDQFKLNNQQAAMCSALLSLLSYEAVRLISDRAKKTAETAADAIGAMIPAPRPYHSIVDTDQAGRPVAHVEVTDPVAPSRNAIGAALKESIPIPPGDPDADLLRKLDDMDSI